MVAARRIGDFEYRGSGSFPAWLAAIAENAARKVVVCDMETTAVGGVDEFRAGTWVPLLRVGVLASVV